MKKIFDSFKNSCNGIKLAWVEDHSFRNSSVQVLIGTILASGLVAYYNESSYIWLLLVGSLFPIIIVELINCSIEAVTDKASPERHPLAMRAKDMGSGAVLLTRVLAGASWLVVICNF